MLVRDCSLPYAIEIIDVETKHRLWFELVKRPLFTRKADIYGCCIKLLTDNRGVSDLWSDNLYSANENMRSHGRLLVVDDPAQPPHVKYDPYTKTALVFNIDYYGWIKSVALAVAGEILEDSHEIYSVHGAALDVNGSGVAIVAGSGVGKTTHSWGMLRNPGVRLLADDWFFVRVYERSLLAYGSEKNCYVDADLGQIWKEYQHMLDRAVFDKRGRAVVNARWVVGNDGVIPMTVMKKVVILKRDQSDSTVLRELEPEEAFEILLKNNFYNPHQLVNDVRKTALRSNFFRNLLKRSRVFLANTAHPAAEVQGEIFHAVTS
ncbi:MAG: hypothetical protein QFX35_02750 [Candidatus Verstraetearchaeota archaeon]|nr:hypothetical protein [Candidatus Verstraetearchaeota archaeon]